jgi:hypothetical protein
LGSIQYSWIFQIFKQCLENKEITLFDLKFKSFEF